MEIVLTNTDIWDDGQGFSPPRSGRLSECLFVHQ